jgi:hypothetical protein
VADRRWKSGSKPPEPLVTLSLLAVCNSPRSIRTFLRQFTNSFLPGIRCPRSPAPLLSAYSTEERMLIDEQQSLLHCTGAGGIHWRQPRDSAFVAIQGRRKTISA